LTKSSNLVFETLCPSFCIIATPIVKVRTIYSVTHCKSFGVLQAIESFNSRDETFLVLDLFADPSCGATFMKRVYPDAGWPSSWKYSYHYDLVEIYGEKTQLGYAYAYQNRRDLTLEFLSEVLPPGAHVLDIAAAQGNLTLALAERGYHVTWNDLRSELAGYVQAKYESGTVSFAPGNAFDLKFPKPFDAVLITEVIEHVAHPDDFLNKVAKLVRPGGFIIMTTPNGRYFKNNLPRFSDCSDPSVFESVQYKPDSDGHIFLLHRDEVEQFARTAGLCIDRVCMFNNPLTCGHIKLERLLKVLPKPVVNACEAFGRSLPSPLVDKFSVQMAVRFRVTDHSCSEF